MRSSPKSPLPALRHYLTPSHPDVGLDLDAAFLKAQARGDIVQQIDARYEHGSLIRDWLKTRAVMVMTSDEGRTATHERLLIVFLRQWEAEDFTAWLDSQAAMARLLGLTA